jgi:hypothetical protein
MRNRGVEVFMSGGEDDDSVRDASSEESSENSSALDVKGQSLFEDDPSSQTLTNVDDLEGVLAAAGVPAGAPRRAYGPGAQSVGERRRTRVVGPFAGDVFGDGRGV